MIAILFELLIMIAVIYLIFVNVKDIILKLKWLCSKQKNIIPEEEVKKKLGKDYIDPEQAVSPESTPTPEPPPRLKKMKREYEDPGIFIKKYYVEPDFDSYMKDGIYSKYLKSINTYYRK